MTNEPESFTRQRNSWAFCSAINSIVTSLITKETIPDREVVDKVTHDFMFGVTPNMQRYELDARL